MNRRLIDDATSGLGGMQPPRVSIDQNKFTLIDPSGFATPVPMLPDGPALDVVFVDANPKTSKLYWGRGYQPGQQTPPLCFSDNGVAPSALAQDPQAQTCAACPHNVIGSATSPFSGAPIKACQDFKKLAVVIQNHDGCYLFTVKPGSFKNFSNYINYLRMQKMPNGGAPDLTDVVTRVRFASQGVVSFEAISLVPQDMQARIDAIWAKNEQVDATGMIVGKHDVPMQGQLEAPAQAAPPPASPFQQAPQAAPPPPPPPPPASPFLQAAPTPAPAATASKRSVGRPRKVPDAPPAEAPPTAPPWDQSAPAPQNHGLAQAQAPTKEMLDRIGAAFKLST